MDFEDKKTFALQFVRLGIDPLRAMMQVDFTEEEMTLAKEDTEFQNNIDFEIRMEEIDLLKKLNTAMDVAVAKGNSQAVQWKLERLNKKWNKTFKTDDDDGKDNGKVLVYLPANGRD